MAATATGPAPAGVGNWLQENPEVFSIALDKIGQGFAPNNPFAGVGTFLGQSSLADKARQKTEEQNQMLMGALIKAMGGSMPTKTAETPAAPGSNLTAAHLPGPTKEAYSTDAQGNVVKTTTETVPNPKKEASSVNLTDVLPLFNP